MSFFHVTVMRTEGGNVLISKERHNILANVTFMSFLIVALMLFFSSSVEVEV